MVYVRRALWDMLYADGETTSSKSVEGVNNRTTFAVIVFEAAYLTVSEKETEIMLLRTPDQATLPPPLVVGAAGQRNKQTAHLLFLGGQIDENVDLSYEIDERVRLKRACLKQFVPELYDRTAAPISLNVQMLMAEVIETLLHRCVKWTFSAEHFAKLQRVHHQVHLRMFGFHRRRRTDHATIPYAEALDHTFLEHQKDHPYTVALFCGGRGAEHARRD